MTTYPPTPTVEEEVVAMSKELRTLEAVHKTSEDHAVPSRGDVNQIPVLIESDVDSSVPTKMKEHPPKLAKPTHLAHRSSLPPSVENDQGLLTPPQSDSDNEVLIRGRTEDKSGMNSARIPRSRSPSRPAPGSYDTRSGTTADVRDRSETQRDEGSATTAACRSATSSLILPSAAPRSYLATQSDREEIKDRTQNHAASPWNHVRAETVRSDDQNSRHSSPGFVREDSVRSNSSTSDSSKFRTNKLAPSIVLREKEPRNPSELQEWTGFPSPRGGLPAGLDCNGETSSAYRSYRSFGQDTRRTSDLVDGPGKDNILGSTKKSSLHDSCVQPRDSRSYQPKQLNDMTDRLRAGDETSTRAIHQKQEIGTPNWQKPVPKPDNAEDYFTRHVSRNTRRANQSSDPRLYIDTRGAASPRASSSLTPQSERFTNQDYFLTPKPSPQQSPVHSRHSSFNATQSHDPRAHPSLLSQSTATAAIRASRLSLQVPLTPVTFVDTENTQTNSHPRPILQSRPQSPGNIPRSQVETPYRDGQIMAVPSYATQPGSRRANTRDSLPRIHNPSLFVPTPQRNASWSEYEPRSAIGQTTPTTFASQFATLSATVPCVEEQSQSYHVQSQTRQETRKRPSNEIRLPLCPRSKPVKACNDWSTLDGASHMRICPTCKQTIIDTGYGFLLRPAPRISSSDRISCSFSEPWVRVALVQSHNQKKNGLNYVYEVSDPPAGCRPCRGNKADVRMWWILREPTTLRAVKGFYACSSCVRNVHQIFPLLEEEFEKNEALQQEHTCSLQQDGKHFANFVRILDEVNMSRSSRYRNPLSMQPFIDYLRRIEGQPQTPTTPTVPVSIIKTPVPTPVPASIQAEQCTRNALLVNRPWHFADELPELTICGSCYVSVVFPARDQNSLARNISMVSRLMPASIMKSARVIWSIPDEGSTTTAMSCQLYSDRMRALFNDFVNGRLPYEGFVTRVKERQAVHHRIVAQNRMFAQDERMGIDRSSALEENRTWWQKIE